MIRVAIRGSGLAEILCTPLPPFLAEQQPGVDLEIRVNRGIHRDGNIDT